MQRVLVSAGKAVCRYCGETVQTNSLSAHILKFHPRPALTNMTPTLVRKRVTIVEPDAEK
jgi:hypothetical protein